ncbi:hypothetical protein SK128_023319 [Halocaridina rubra]|uniref:Uncharacterized protein n=1 Tax=Halocaridina rubra TaxID=373956 RepID=A0AAN8ZXC6_HALRR
MKLIIIQDCRETFIVCAELSDKLFKTESSQYSICKVPRMGKSARRVCLEVLIKELYRTPNWVSFAITISKGFEYVPYKLNQWPTGTSVQPFRGSKQWSYQNKQQRANGTIPYMRDYRKRHDTNLSYRRPSTRDFSWSDGSYNPRHSPRHTNFGKARSYHGTYSNQHYTSNGRLGADDRKYPVLVRSDYGRDVADEVLGAAHSRGLGGITRVMIPTTSNKVRVVCYQLAGKGGRSSPGNYTN